MSGVRRKGVDMLRVAREYGKFRKHKMIPSYRFSQFKIFSVILKPVSANSGFTGKLIF